MRCSRIASPAARTCWRRRRIALALAAKGIAVLRFDFTGLGSSEGDFANSTFSSNVADLVRAADHLRETRKAPAILIGHSLGGAAVLAAAGQIPDARAVVTIAAPSDPAHVTGLFKDRIEDIRKHGKVEVSLAGRPFHITREFLDDIAEHGLMAHVANLHKALLIMHSPTDDTVGIDNATRIFVAAKHPKSFVSLADADHLLSGRRDAAYVADVIAAWATRYLDPAMPEPAADPAEAPRAVVVRETRASKFQQTVSIGPHRMLADEPVAAGGEDTGPGPYDFVLAGLGACTSMTMRLYADRKSLPLERTTVTLTHSKIHAEDCAECETKAGMLDEIDLDDCHGGQSRRRTAQAADGDRRQVPGAPYADVGDSHRHARGGLTNNRAGVSFAAKEHAHARRGPGRSQDRLHACRMEPADLAQLVARHVAGGPRLGHDRGIHRAGDAVAQSADLADRRHGGRRAPARASPS